MCNRIAAIVCALIVVLSLTTLRANAADWPVFGHDSARSSFAVGDTALSTANVGKLHRRWVATLDAPADTAPILVSNVRSRDGKTKRMLYETTKIGVTYGIDADSGSVVWKFVTHGPGITTSVPAADPSGEIVYAPGVDGYVHKLLAADGTEMRGTGFPAQLTLMPDIEKDASSLNVANGFLYAVTSGYLGDQGHYVGHLLTVRLHDGSTRVFNTLCAKLSKLLQDDECPGRRAGIWARAGAVVDPDPSMHGRVYFSTGNGPFTANAGGHDYGDSLLSVSADGSRLEDFFTPTNYHELEFDDQDLSSVAPAMLPRQAASNTPLMAVQGGKDADLRLLDRRHLGGVGGELQDVRVDRGVFSAIAVLPDGATPWIFVGTEASTIALRLSTDGRGRSSLARVWSKDIAARSPVLANGMLFVATDGSMYALDSRTGKTLWSTWIGGIHWESPIVANGCVYISDEDSRVTAYCRQR